MILGNRRLRLLYLALAGMDMAALLPWLTVLSIFWARNGDPRAQLLEAWLTQDPLFLFILLWSTMQLYMVLGDLLNQWKVSGALHALAIVGVLAITSLLGVRILLYPGAAPGDFRWLRETVFALLSLVSGVRGEILLILANYFLWLRVARYTDRSLTFFAIGVSFRLGMLLVILGSTVLSYWGQQNGAAILYMLLFFAFGLCAVALARIDQKAVGTANSSGALLPWDRFAQLWVVIIALLATAFAAATLYTPPLLRTVLGWFAPVGQVVQWIVGGFAFLLFMLLTPFLEWLTQRIQEMMAKVPPVEMGEEIPTPPPLTFSEAVQEFAMLRYCIVGGLILAAIVILLVVFVRVARRQRTSEAEDTDTAGGVRASGLNLGLDRLKEWFALLRRYGLGSQLLAAISVENIYANLTRIARAKGYPRPRAYGPDKYLPMLYQAFPEHEAELNTITAAYMRVRYAERPITTEELDALRAAYTAATAPEKDTGQRATT